ncbi:hypothetical protein C8C78_12629 [Halanaerobium congolense]|jgi:hypothetical protein|uniref:Uncharacterized protein n=1 Tax=Halanaerobium congolense TaxID=54121 RepID=A0A318E4P6_9FIRM|nr:hypothetical protein [Halanaerobium congolense]PXV63092.1 hypothetical protein C8C78_12629 [Halanaerobium congolense]
MDANIQQVQVVLFYNFWKSTNLFKIADSFDKSFANIFDGGQKSVLPVNDQTPPEVPRIIMSSQNGEYQFQLSLLRANFIIQGEVSSKINKAVDFAKKITDVSLNDYNWSINRVGLVINAKKEFNNNALKFLDKHYFSNNLQSQEKQKEIHSLIEDVWEDEKVNQWLRLKANDNYLNIVVDRNLVPDDDRDLSKSDIFQYLEISSEKIKEIISNLPDQ